MKKAVNCGIVFDQDTVMLQNGALEFFLFLRPKTELQWIFSVVSSVFFLAEFKTKYSDTFQESMFYNKRLGIIGHSLLRILSIAENYFPSFCSKGHD